MSASSAAAEAAQVARAETHSQASSSRPTVSQPQSLSPRPAALKAGGATKAKQRAQGSSTKTRAWYQQPPLLAAAVSGGGLALGLAVFVVKRLLGGGKAKQQPGGAADSTVGRWCHLKATSKCVPLADGSACVIRREIPADNSCLFNAIGYCMHKSKIRAPHLRNVVAQQVSGDRTTYSTAFLGMTNEAYCQWIRQPVNWGGGIELSILAQAYGIEIAAWNIESTKNHVFGEEQGYKRQVMVIYNGVHYDALAICQGPKANPDDDLTDFNPRTKRGKMIIAAARKLTELTHRGSKFYKGGKKVEKQALGAGVRLQCGECKKELQGQEQAQAHAKATGHTQFAEIK